MDPRALAARVLVQVTEQGQSLTAALSGALEHAPRDARALIQELCYGTLRWYPRLDALAQALLAKPLKRKDHDIAALLLLGLYQLIYLRIPPHAAVAQTVAAAEALGKGWAKGLVNGVLRNFQRRAQALLQQVDASEPAGTAHPAWLLALLRQAWPQDWPAIVAANNARAPMTLRVNPRRGSREALLARLADAGMAAAPLADAPQALVLERPVDVAALPGFAEGQLSVQDGAAQLAGPLLGLAPGQRVLDACAAPGGKTCQLAELEPELAELVALDVDGERLRRVAENLGRLGLQATLIEGDAGAPAQWWDGRVFDRILLDAPCSATGVIRRHPDIKLLRRAADIEPLCAEQRRLLDALWPLLKPGGRLVYATCSILPQENAAQIDAFLQRTADAREAPIAASWGRRCGSGRQILPGEAGMDGFYYACIEKRA